MEIMHKNNMIYIGKQICLYLKNKVNSNLVSIYYCKMGYSLNVCMKDQKKKMEEKCLHYVGNSIQRTSINYNEVLDTNEQHSLPH